MRGGDMELTSHREFYPDIGPHETRNSCVVLQESYVGLSHVLFPRDLQAAHQILGDGNALLFRLIGAKDDFQVHEIAKVLDLIEINARLAHTVDQPLFPDGAHDWQDSTGSSSGLPERCDNGKPLDRRYPADHSE